MHEPPQKSLSRGKIGYLRQTNSLFLCLVYYSHKIIIKQSSSRRVYCSFYNKPLKVSFLTRFPLFACRRVAKCKPGKPGLSSVSETLALFFIQFLSFRKMNVQDRQNVNPGLPEKTGWLRAWRVYGIHMRDLFPNDQVFFMIHCRTSSTWSSVFRTRP